MKKIVITLIAALIAVSSYAQIHTDTLNTNFTEKDSLVIGYLHQILQNSSPQYKLYQTDNIWTFLELDTTSGRIWQVQYSLKGSNYRYKVVLNGEPLLSSYDDGGYAGRFELYKTQNMYNFILLDTATGSTWQVQWSTEAKERGIMRIL